MAVLLPVVESSAYRSTFRFVDTLAGLGLRDAVFSPGSRNAPLVLALDRHPTIRLWMHHDERSASFFALGLAKASRRPVAVATTSGTAAAELLPAAVEATYGTVPLLLLTADRPPELRGIGSPQTIDQVRLFGSHARWIGDVAPAELDTDRLADLALRLWSAAAHRPAGPAHLNLAYREPFVPEDLTVEPGAERRHQPVQATLDDSLIERLTDELDGRRVLLVAGPTNDRMLPASLLHLAAKAGWPVVADPLSQLRTGARPVVTTGEVLFRAELPSEPEVVIRFGAPPTSKVVTEAIGLRRYVVVDEVPGRDPTRGAEMMLTGDPAAVADALAARVKPAPRSFASVWHDADRAVREVLDEALPFPGGPAVARIVAEALPAAGILYVASSMPVRDLDLAAGRIRGRILANRGANGIDGMLSAALGAAADTPTVALAGDLSALHDLGAIAAAARLDLPVVFVVVNNDGGGIFHLLPQVELEPFERLFGTPHGLSLRNVAAACGLDAVSVDRAEDLVHALRASHPRLVEVTTDRVADATARRRVVETALRR